MAVNETNSHKANPTQLIENIKVGSPATVSLNASFHIKNVEVPEIFDLSSIERFTFNRPSIQKLKSEFIPQQTSFSEVKLTFAKKKRKTKEVHPNELASFTKRLYRFKLKALMQLEKVFNNNPKMTDIINSIKKQYE